jgi:hypothetical protein
MALTDGTVAAEQKISDLHGGFGPGLDDYDEFARSVANIGDSTAMVSRTLRSASPATMTPAPTPGPCDARNAR